MEIIKINEPKYQLTVSKDEMKLITAIFNKISPADLSTVMDNYLSCEWIATTMKHSCREDSTATKLREIEE